MASKSLILESGMRNTRMSIATLLLVYTKPWYRVPFTGGRGVAPGKRSIG